MHCILYRCVGEKTDSFQAGRVNPFGNFHKMLKKLGSPLVPRRVPPVNVRRLTLFASRFS